MKTKICNKCKIKKDISEFGKHQLHLDGLQSYCKLCKKQIDKKYRDTHIEEMKKYRLTHKEETKKYTKRRYQENKEKLKEKRKKYYQTHKKQEKQYQKKYCQEHKKEISVRIKKYHKIYYQTHKKEIRKYYEKHKEELLKKKREHYQKHKEKILLQHTEYRKNHKEEAKQYRLKHRKERIKYGNQYDKNRRKIDINFRLAHYLRTRLNKVLKNNTKLESALKLVGCSLEQLKKHLESKFVSGMSWANYGKWHIDHIKPCAKFDLRKKSEQRKCFRYTNLQPLWAKENLSKSDKY